MQAKKSFESFFSKTLPNLSRRYPWVVMIIFLLITAFFGYQIPKIKIDTDVTSLTTGGEEETRAIETAARDFTVGDPLHVILLGDMEEHETLHEAAAVVDKIRMMPNTMQVVSPFDVEYYTLMGFSVRGLPVAPTIPTNSDEVDQFKARLALSPNGKGMISDDNEALLVDVYLGNGYGNRGKQSVDELEKMLTDVWGEDNFHLAGNSYLAYATDQSIRQDALTLFPLAALIVIMVLLISFKNLYGVLIPGATILVSLIFSLGAMAWCGSPLTIVSVILPVMIIVMGSADGIHILHKYYDEIEHTDNKGKAIDETMRLMVPPCIMTSITTAVGLFSLRTSSVIPVQDFGTFSGIGVLIALVFALTGIPAMLALLPRPKSITPKAQRAKFSDVTFLRKTGLWVMNHTQLVTVIGIALFILSVVGVMHLTVEANVAMYFRSSSPVAQGIRVYEEKFGGSADVLVIVDTHKPQGTLDPDFLMVIDELENFVHTLPLVSNTSSMASIARDFSPDGELHGEFVAQAYQQLPRNVTSVFLSRDQQQKALIHTKIMSAETTKVSETIHEMELGLQKLSPDEMTVTVAGMPKIIQHHIERFSESQVKSTLWSVLMVFMLMVVFHQSFLVGVLAMLPLMFTIGINFGLMGWLGIPLDAATVLIGSIAVGIGIDYSIHFISRVKTDQYKDSNLKLALQRSITSVGHAIMINAATLIAGFLILLLSRFSILAIFGSLVVLTMGISAVTALTVLPALLHGARKKLIRRFL